MSKDIRGFVPDSCELLALGEPTHLEPAFAMIRNELFGQLADLGFRSVALETDRVSAHVVDEFVRGGVGSLESAMTSFTHTFGELAANWQLIGWMREYNKRRPAEEQLAFHGFDIPTEMMSAPSPRPYLEFVRDYLGLDLDIAAIAGDDERWSRTEAIMDPAASPGDSADARALREIADDLHVALYRLAPELVEATSAAAWRVARDHLDGGVALLRYHRQSAKDIERNARITSLFCVRDAHMAEHLLDIRAIEAHRGPTLVFSQNQHLQRNGGGWRLADMELRWWPAGASVGAVLGERYTMIAGSLGRSDAIGLGEPGVDTVEGGLQRRFSDWGMTTEVAPGATRTDTTPPQGYFPLDQATVAGADAILHVTDGTVAVRSVETSVVGQ